MTDNDEQPQSRGGKFPEGFTMKNLRKQSPALIDNGSDDEIDDMPFVSSKQARGIRTVKR